MISKINYGLNDTVELKKEHPCATRSKVFVITRMGADIKIKCVGCGNTMMLTRYNFDKNLKKLIKKAD
jgi:hypothetical protein